MASQVSYCSRWSSGTTNARVSSRYESENRISRARFVVTATPDITRSQYPSARSFARLLTIDGHEGEAHAHFARQPVRELDVEAHEVAALIEEGERQRVGQVPDAQHLALFDRLERRQVRGGCRGRRARDRGVDRLVKELHRRQHLVLRILLGQTSRKERRVPPMTTITRTAVMPAYDRSGPRRQRMRPVTAQATSSATVNVCTAATSDPTRELMTPSRETAGTYRPESGTGRAETALPR